MANSKPAALLKVLGVGFGIATIVGNTIGSGILRMPGTIAGYITNEWLVLLLWLLGGLLALAGAVIYAEAGTAYPFTGGPYAYSEKVFGKQAGFTVGVCDWILNIASNAALAIAASEYINAFTGWQAYTTLQSMGIIVALSAVQWFGIQSSSTIQQALSLLKALGLLFLVGAFFFHGATNEIAHSHLPAVSSTPVSFFGAVILSFRAILFTYCGWNAPVYFSEENTDAQKNLPRSLIYGVLVLTIIYLLVNASILFLLPASSIANSALAVADGASVVFGEAGRTIVTGISIVIVLSCLYAGLLYAPRIIFGVARSGLFFPFAATLNRYHTPGAGLIATLVIAIAFIASGTFTFIISVYTFLYVFIDTSVYAAALVSRYKNKAPLSYKAPGYPALHLFLILINLALLVSVFMEDRQSSVYAVTIVLLTTPLYYLFKMLINNSAESTRS